MKTYGHKSVDPRKYAKRKFGYSSASFLQSLMTALLLSTLAVLLAVAVGDALYCDHFTSYASAAGALLANTLVGICLATIALERTRKRSVRRTLELAFLNHHVHNALTQMTIASNATDTDKHGRFMRDAVSRISEGLLRVGNESDVARLSRCGPWGKDLTRERQEREKQWLARWAQPAPPHDIQIEAQLRENCLRDTVTAFL
jgi:hypothetical protein